MSQLTWGIDIHDAVLCNPEDGVTVREANAAVKMRIYEDRNTILNDYFQSVGIRPTPKAMEEWEHLKSLITPLDAPLECSMWCMK